MQCERVTYELYPEHTKLSTCSGATYVGPAAAGLV
jgi:hypothetical protein